MLAHLNIMDANIQAGYTAICDQWQCVFDHLTALDLLDAATCQRMVDGRMLAKALGVKPGQWMATALDVCMEWQFNNPEATEIEDAIEEVRSRSAELGIPNK